MDTRVDKIMSHENNHLRERREALKKKGGGDVGGWERRRARNTLWGLLDMSM